MNLLKGTAETVSKTQPVGSGANDLCLQQIDWKEKITEMKGTDIKRLKSHIE